MREKNMQLRKYSDDSPLMMVISLFILKNIDYFNSYTFKPMFAAFVLNVNQLKIEF